MNMNAFLFCYYDFYILMVKYVNCVKSLHLLDMSHVPGIHISLRMKYSAVAKSFM